ncbi:hypothetical protein ERC79_13635 [Rhodococcus sp. ABRD24]|uniref:PEP/pyruvate-binding domain-containing protein n=1 Tax=Rhodococcus sp. ABRD24 TaxID=2507582 RepID=UPI00103AEBE7|nr:PEP/pyruvate-binding domain-containing protein [Rhodococcus sp. ABRD24]QBJ96875.1 hypothetical protein ERC79_13635 [Rhodococcus sp. ABRD24]
MTMLDLATRIADPSIYGWKAHYLSRLMEQGFVVPGALALAPDEVPVLSGINSELAYAVRSSGLAEDTHTGSYAGHFKTNLGVRGLRNLLASIDEVRMSGAGEMPMGVVIQEMVDRPIVSGVAFSCHPVTLARDVAVVSWVRGLGEGLVSGTAIGNDVEVRLQDGAVSSGEWPLGVGLLRELADILRKLEDLVGQPVDVEWSVTESETLVLLQLRPIVLPIPGVTDLDTVGAFASLPAGIASHSKLWLRSEATRLGVPMARARAILATGTSGIPTVSPFLASDHSAGRSVVLLHPARVEGKIVREFTKDCATDVEFFVRGCQRYAIRQYPPQAGAAQSIARTLGMGLEHGPVACVIEQEILHAYATGILRRTPDGYLVEAALGHFVPKGYIQTSTYALTQDLSVTLRDEVPQSKAYHFLNGHVIVESPPYEQLVLADSDLQRLVRAMLPILDRRPAVALEFGLLGSAGNELEPYMIDVAESDSEVDVFSVADIERGVVSAGRAMGRLVDLRVDAVHDDLNAHLYDTALNGGAALGPTVYIARQASIDLLPLVRAAHPSSGFIFERASLLAHLPVVLRERGLAAVTLPAKAIDSLIDRADRLAINTYDEEIVVHQEASEA